MIYWLFNYYKRWDERLLVGNLYHYTKSLMVLGGRDTKELDVQGIESCHLKGRCRSLRDIRNHLGRHRGRVAKSKQLSPCYSNLYQLEIPLVSRVSSLSSS